MLDNFGKIAVGELVIYPPILCLSVFVALRHGFSPKDAWICLFLFCSVRIVGSVLSIVSQSQSDPSAGLLEAVAIVQALGLSPLLLSTLGFVKTIAEYGGLPSFITRVLHVHVHILVTIGVALAVIGGTKLSPSNSPSSQASGHTLSKAGTACFLVAYITLSGVLVLLWRATERIPQNHRKLLRNLSLVFPVLAVRVLYSVLGAFVPSPSKWSPTTGDWKLYLIMALVMECIVVCTYVVTGALFPLQRGGYLASPTTSRDEGLEIGRRGKHRTLNQNTSLINLSKTQNIF